MLQVSPCGQHIAEGIASKRVTAGIATQANVCGQHTQPKSSTQNRIKSNETETTESTKKASGRAQLTERTLQWMGRILLFLFSFATPFSYSGIASKSIAV